MILVAGSINIDFAVRVQAVACARAGAPVQFVGCVGTDDYGEQLRRALQADGIGTTSLRRVEGQTGAAFVTVGSDGENTIAVASGVNRALRETDLPELNGVTHLILQLESPLETVRAFAQAARRAGVHVTLNAAPAQPLDDELLGLVDLLIVNAGELEALRGDQAGPGLDQQLEVLTSRGPKAIVVTLGADGAALWANGRCHRSPAFEVQAVDTTGAGDTFVGVLVAALRHMGLIAAVRQASAAAALSCTGYGAQISMPRSPDIERLLAPTLL